MVRTIIIMVIIIAFSKVFFRTISYNPNSINEAYNQIEKIVYDIKSNFYTAINEDTLLKRNGIYYFINSEVPYTGKVESYYNSTNKNEKTIRTSYYLKDGQYVGEFVHFYFSGQKRFEVFYNFTSHKGEDYTVWYENGQIKEHGYKNKSDYDVYEIYYPDGQISQQNITSEWLTSFKTKLTTRSVRTKKWNQDGIMIRDDKVMQIKN